MRYSTNIVIGEISHVFLVGRERLWVEEFCRSCELTVDEACSRRPKHLLQYLTYSPQNVPKWYTCTKCTCQKFIHMYNPHIPNRYTCARCLLNEALLIWPPYHTIYSTSVALTPQATYSLCPFQGGRPDFPRWCVVALLRHPTCILRWLGHLCNVAGTIKCSPPITSASSTSTLYHNKRAGKIVTHTPLSFLLMAGTLPMYVITVLTVQSGLWQLLKNTWPLYPVSIIRSTRVLKVIKRFL